MRAHVLLIGGDGFVGTYLVRRLRAWKKYNVSVVHLRPFGPKERIPGTKYYRVDAAKKSRVFSSLISRSSVVVILTPPSPAIIRNVLSALPAARLLKKIIYASTLLLYKDLPGLHAESEALKPESGYENGKALEEQLLARGLRGTDIKLCIARLSNVYGDVKNRGLIHLIFLAALRNGVFTMNGNGKQVRDYIFVEDVAKFLRFLIAYEQKSGLEIFNISTGIGHNVRQLVRMIGAVTGKRIKTIQGPEQPEKRFSRGDNGKIISVSGYLSPRGLTAGLKTAHHNYLKYTDWQAERG